MAGLSGEPFACVHDTIDTSGPESTRTALWRRGEVLVGIAATAIESGRGVHGDRTPLTGHPAPPARLAATQRRLDAGWPSASSPSGKGPISRRD
ncbi:MAG: hypothetical protein IPN17_29230 [Deltaproteobacteria bacterium]|nr:hypothetical protein [Deltaproteobacteria bacterium]